MRLQDAIPGEMTMLADGGGALQLTTDKLAPFNPSDAIAYS